MTDNPTAYYLGESIVPPVWTICGVELKPFSLGHYILLERIQNPIVAEEKQEVSIQEYLRWLFQAIVICAMSYEENLKVLNDNQLYTATMEKFLANLKQNMELDKSWNFFSKRNAFNEYIQYYNFKPLYSAKQKKQSGLPSGMDWKMNLYLTFKKLGYTETEILNMSLRKLFFEWTAYAESEGIIEVWNRVDVLDNIARKRGLVK